MKPLSQTKQMTPNKDMKPKVSESWEKEFDKKLPPGVETWSEETPHWLAFEGLCNHDDSFFCKHRRNYVKSFIQSLLDQQKQEVVEMVSDVCLELRKEHLEISKQHGFGGSHQLDLYLTQMRDYIIKRLEGERETKSK